MKIKILIISLCLFVSSLFSQNMTCEDKVNNFAIGYGILVSIRTLETNDTGLLQELNNVNNLMEYLEVMFKVISEKYPMDLVRAKSYFIININARKYEVQRAYKTGITFIVDFMKKNQGNPQLARLLEEYRDTATRDMHQFVLEFNTCK